MDKQNYEKGGSAGSKGSQFQVRLLVVFLLNALRMRLLSWRLSTEDKRAGKFDDVVLEWPDGTVLLQAKHKENKKRITVDQLMSTTSKNDDFSIPKYFLSYQAIKDKFPSLTKTVICTNASVNERALTFLNPQTDSSDSLLFCDSHKVFYTLDDNILPGLKDKIKTYYNQNSKGREDDILIISDESLKDFQIHFQIYFDYPSGNVLENVIEQLLDRTDWRAKASASEIYSKVMDWFQEKGGKFFTELHATALVSEIRRDKYWQTLKQYDVYFLSSDLNFEDSNRRYHFVAEAACLLQEIRIWQALHNIRRRALYVHPDDSVEDKKQLIEAFGLPNYTILIIVQPNESVTMEMWGQIEKNLSKYANKKVVLLTERDNELVRRIQSSDNSFDVTKEPPTLENLLKKTRDRLLKMKNILFQGECISMEDLFVPESIRDYSTSIGSEILERLVANEQIKVGSGASLLEKGDERCYIRRTFTRDDEECDEENIFDVNDKLILIADSAGTGKTTSLTKLTGIIKKSNPHVWIFKIVLDHYSNFLRDSLRKHKSAVDVMAFLDSQEATRLPNQLDKLVFSVNNKVVLMLDGVDEVSPNFTQLVESLLANCLKAVNVFKIFATTRRHLTEKLEGKFQVKSFGLQPFSRSDQIDFLKNLWIRNIGHADIDRCERYARALVAKMASLTESRSRWDNIFSDLPLQLNMLAQIFQQNGRIEGVVDWEGCKDFLNSDSFEPKLPEKHLLTILYKLFIEEKREVFVDKLNPSGSAAAEQVLVDHFEECLAFHRTLALDTIIYDKRIRNSFSCYKESERNWIPIALKMGIMQEVDSRLIFLHRTFAEYFVAESLVIELQRDNQNAEFQKFLIDEILPQPEYIVIRAFFDGLLHDYVDKLPHHIFQSHQCLSYEIRIYNSLAHGLAEDGCINILRLLLKCVKPKFAKDKETEINGPCRKILSEPVRYGKRYLGNRLNILESLLQQEGIDIRDVEDKTPLHLAARRGRLEVVKFLIEQGANINATCGEGRTPLHEASIHGRSTVVEFLVKQEADFIADLGQEGCVLHQSITRHQVRVVNYLLDKIVEGDGLARGLYAEYAMIPFAAAYLGRIGILKFLVERGMDINTRIENDRSLIFGAVLGEQLGAVKYLVRQGADINSRDIYNNTVLHLVSENSSIPYIGKFFVDLGIDIDVKNDYGMTALHVAVDAGAYDLAEVLIKNGADVNTTNRFEGNSVLHTAALNNHPAIVELLAEHGADVNAKNSSGDALLHSFTKLRRLDVVKLLVKLGVDVTVQDKDGRTALCLAILENRLNIAKFLVECNIDVNSRDQHGQTELHFLVSMAKIGVDLHFGNLDERLSFHHLAPRRLDMVEHYVARGANFNLTNSQGQTVLHLAILNAVLKCGLHPCGQCLRVIKFLIEQGAGIATGKSREHVKVKLAEEIQSDLRYSRESLDDILQLPVFRLLEPTSLNRENAVSSISVCVGETLQQESEKTPTTSVS